MALDKHNRAFATRASMSGFGLIELVIVIAIVAILTVIALPSYSRIMTRNRVVTDTNDFLAAIILARNEAVSRGRPVTVCASVNGTSCDGLGKSDWSRGYMVFTDFDPVGVVDAGAGDTVLRVAGPVATNDSIKATSGNSGYVSFSRTGLAKFVSADPRKMTFMIRSTPCQADAVRTVSVTSLGGSASVADVCP
jgi:type IV fimbrial biogenesis protein FimT